MRTTQRVAVEFDRVELQRSSPSGGRAEAFSLRLPEGAVVAVAGTPGSGKSLLLAVACGLASPARGSVRLFGAEPLRGRVHPCSALVTETAPLFPRLTVRETLGFAAALNRRWDTGRAEQVLRVAGVGMSRKAGELTVGERAFVWLAVALARTPRLLVIDFPFAELDPAASRRFAGAFLAPVADDGTTVLFSSRTAAGIGDIADTVVVMAGRRVALSGPVSTLVDAHSVVVGGLGGPAGTVARIGGGQGHGVFLVAGSPRGSQRASLDEIVEAYGQAAEGQR